MTMPQTPQTPETHPTPSATTSTTVTFPVSDGSSSNWPKTTRILRNDGSFDYYQAVDKEDPLFVSWCTQISEALQKTFSTSPPIKCEQDSVPKYQVKDLPEGYRLFKHIRGTEKNHREDKYLYGSNYCARFRSRAEFIPHAIWLFNSQPSSAPSSSSTANLELDHSTCKCKYTVRSGRPQTQTQASPSSSSLSSAVTPIDNLSPRTPSKVRTSKVRTSKVRTNASMDTDMDAGTIASGSRWKRWWTGNLDTTGSEKVDDEQRRESGNEKGKEEAGSEEKGKGKLVEVDNKVVEGEGEEEQKQPATVEEEQGEKGKEKARSEEKGKGKLVEVDNEVVEGGCGEGQEQPATVKEEQEEEGQSETHIRMEESIVFRGQKEENLVEDGSKVEESEKKVAAVVDVKDEDGSKVEESKKKVPAVVDVKDEDGEESKEAAVSVADVDGDGETEDEKDSVIFFPAANFTVKEPTIAESSSTIVTAVPSSPSKDNAQPGIDSLGQGKEDQETTNEKIRTQLDILRATIISPGTNEIVFPLSDGTDSGINADVNTAPNGTSPTKTRSPALSRELVTEKEMDRWVEFLSRGIVARLKDKWGLDGDYVVKNLPEGYSLYIHSKILKDRPRKDKYLYGSKFGRFRSINEFVPHAMWLLESSLEASTNSPSSSSAQLQPLLDHSKCQCWHARPVRRSTTGAAASATLGVEQDDSVSPSKDEKKAKSEGKAKGKARMEEEMGSVRVIAQAGDIGSMHREVSSPVQNWNIKAQAEALKRFGKGKEKEKEQERGKGKKRARSLSPESSTRQKARLENGSAQPVEARVFGASGESAGEPGATSGPSNVSTTPVEGQWRSSRKRQAPSFPDGTVFTPLKRGRKSNDSLGRKSETVSSTFGNLNGVMIEDKTRTGSVGNATPRMEGNTTNSAPSPIPAKAVQKQAPPQLAEPRNLNGVVIEDRTRTGSVGNAAPRMEGSTTNSAPSPIPAKAVQKEAPPQSAEPKMNGSTALGAASGSSNATQSTLQGLLFREGELVFVSLRQPIKGPLGDGSDDIRFWPGMIRGITDNRYTLQLLGLPNTRPLSAVPHSSILSYLTFHTSKELRQSLFSGDIWDSNVYLVSNKPEDYFTASFRQVARSYATGLWLAQKFSNSWGSGHPDARPWWLEEDSSRMAMSSTVPIYYRPVVVTHQPGTTFPYLWWGPERLATNDFLRLKPSRNTFHHPSIPNVYQALPPSGPGKMMAASLAGFMAGMITGAGSRGVVMRARVFFVEQLKEHAQFPQTSNKSPGTGTFAVRVCGMLYELADIDWDPPADAPVPLQSPRGANSTSANGPDRLEGMPAPPKGYKFRPILPPHIEAVVSMDVVAGKFYPGTLSHPLLNERLNEAVAATGSQGLDYLWALECVVPGEENAVFSGSSGDEEVGGNHDVARKDKEVAPSSPIWFWDEGKRDKWMKENASTRLGGLKQS